jgi:hypothetical protein
MIREWTKRQITELNGSSISQICSVCLCITANHMNCCVALYDNIYFHTFDTSDVSGKIKFLRVRIWKGFKTINEIKLSALTCSNLKFEI